MKFKMAAATDLAAAIRGFYGCFWRFRAAAQVYHSQVGAMELSLCEPDREFGICILT